MITVTETSLSDVLIIEPAVYGDDRGYFFESYKASDFLSVGITDTFVQDNQSLSQKGVLRGLHFQKPPVAQGKLVRVIQGAIMDVAVDIRHDSPTFGKHVTVELSGENKKMLWVPAGFAHGFLTLQDQTVVSYKCTSEYRPDMEGAIRWNDPALGIAWDVENPLVSEKDQAAGYLQDLAPIAW